MQRNKNNSEDMIIGVFVTAALKVCVSFNFNLFPKCNHPHSSGRIQNVFGSWPVLIDLFSLYVLFSQFRPRDATRVNSFFQMSSYARANVRMTNENKSKIPMRASRGLKWENKIYKLKRVYCVVSVS